MRFWVVVLLLCACSRPPPDEWGPWQQHCLSDRIRPDAGFVGIYLDKDAEVAGMEEAAVENGRWFVCWMERRRARPPEAASGP